MKPLKSLLFILAVFAMIGSPINKAEAGCCTYVTDTGGYAYDECRAATNIAPAIALTTVLLVAIIAVAVQNTHDSSHDHTHHCPTHAHTH